MAAAAAGVVPPPAAAATAAAAGKKSWFSPEAPAVPLPTAAAAVLKAD
jgi:hypothetical protein